MSIHGLFKTWRLHKFANLFTDQPHVIFRLLLRCYTSRQECTWTPPVSKL